MLRVLIIALVLGQSATQPSAPAQAKVKRAPVIIFAPEITDTCTHKEPTTWHTNISLLVSVAGKPEDARIKQTSGYQCHDDDALRAIRGYKFRPATENGIPVPFRLDIETNVDGF